MTAFNRRNRPCEWIHGGDTCQAGPGGSRAESVHRVRNIRLCAYHSPYSVTPENARRFPLEDHYLTDPFKSAQDI